MSTRDRVSTGHIVLIDTGGRLLVKTGEHLAREDWHPRQ
jgi:hypothetical protein